MEIKRNTKRIQGWGKEPKFFLSLIGERGSGQVEWERKQLGVSNLPLSTLVKPEGDIPFPSNRPRSKTPE